MSDERTEQELELLKRLAELRWAAADGTPGVTRGERLGPGGWLGFRTGHWEVTRDVAERFGFSPDAVAVLKDAAQDPDFYEFTNPSAHAQTPDGDAAGSGARSQDAQQAYAEWVLHRVVEVRGRAASGQARDALYLLGYLLHGIEDLAPHGGMTNREHHHLGAVPDRNPVSIALARSYAERFLRGLVDAIGPASFDSLRNWRGDSSVPKSRKERLLGNGWDLVAGVREYMTSKWDPQADVPIRWPIEVVFGQILDGLRRASRESDRPLPPMADLDSDCGRVEPDFVPLTPPEASSSPAAWTVMVYMAGDDANPNGIEYAVRQDLMELKAAGSTAQVHLLAQSDECRERNNYRYRLRRGTALEADRIAVFAGDLNTGRVKTLVDFVAWAKRSFPAQHYALVLWGHGSGHDDGDVYRLARGRITPRVAAQLAGKRLGFFGGTRRAVIERFGATRGYGFDDTAQDFLDDVELGDALAAITGVLGMPVDVLAFDACLMGMVEIAWQVREHAQYMVASQFPEPGDGYCYSTALAPLVANPSLSPRQLASALVDDYGKNYPEQTLSSVCLGEVQGLGESLERLTRGLSRDAFYGARLQAIDCLARDRSGYRDIGGFVEALRETDAAGAQAALQALTAAVVEHCGETSGLSVYLPSEYWPEEAGSTDQLYERLRFAQDFGWAALLRRIYPPQRPRGPAARSAPPPEPTVRNGSLYAIDAHNVGEAQRGGRVQRSFWTDLTRASVVDGELVKIALAAAAEPASDAAPRILILPGIMGSALSDRKGHHGLCWIDPLGLAAGSDFEVLELGADGEGDADHAVRIDAVSSIPIVYDRLALALIAAFGPVVEHAPYDWRRSISWNARRLRQRLERREGRPTILVAHSMGGLVAAKALEGQVPASVRALVTLGTPWLGSCAAVQGLQGEAEKLRIFAALSALRLPTIVRVIRSFWGLSDLVPDDPRVQRALGAAAGPFRDAEVAAQRLASLRTLCRRPPPIPTLAVFADHLPTPVPAGCDGSGELELDLAGGDGTVSSLSATANGSIAAQVRVRAPHAQLPLCGDAITAAIDFVQQHGGRRTSLPARLLATPAPSMPTVAETRGHATAVRATDRRSQFMDELGALEDTALPLERLLDLMPLA